MSKTVTQEFQFKSKSNPNGKGYTALLYADGTTSCNCRGWTIKKSDKERGCRHTKEVEADNPVGAKPAVKTAKPKARDRAGAATWRAAASQVGIQDVEPMCAGVLAGDALKAAWTDQNYIAEEKLDGARYILHLGALTNRLFSRRKSVVDDKRIEKTENVPHLKELRHNLAGTILDGEIISGPGCKSNDVSRIMGSNHLRAIEVQENVGFVHYKVFDILQHRGEDLRNVPYGERYQILRVVLQQLGSEHLSVPDRETSDKKELYDRIIKAGGEGIILKDLRGLYTEGARTAVWAKVKRHSSWNVICSGFTVGRNAFAETFGAMKFSMYVNGELTEVGQCSGMTLKLRRQASLNREALIGQVFEVTGQEMTSGGRIRHPQFKGWRMDVDPRTVRLEDESKSI